MVCSRRVVARIRARENAAATRPCNGNAAAHTSRFSFIRTVTVGPGIAPGLLTLRSWRREGARGLPRRVAATAGGEFRPALRTLSALRADTDILGRPARHAC